MTVFLPQEAFLFQAGAGAFRQWLEQGFLHPNHPC